MGINKIASVPGKENVLRKWERQLVTVLIFSIINAHRRQSMELKGLRLSQFSEYQTKERDINAS